MVLTMTKGTVTSADGTQITYEYTGDGPAVILVGGALTDRSAGKPLATALADHFTTYVFDRRGRRDSGDTPPYALGREIEDLAALCDAAGGEAFLYGVSSGAVLAFEAVAAGLPVPRLAMFEPPYVFAPEDPDPAAQREHLQRLLAEDRRGEALEYFLREAVGLPSETVASMRQGPMWAALEALAHTLVYDLTVVGDGRVPVDRMAAVAVPTLVLDSAASSPRLRRAAEATAAALPAGAHRSLAGQFHEIPPQELAPVLTRFFRDRG